MFDVRTSIFEVGVGTSMLNLLGQSSKSELGLQCSIFWVKHRSSEFGLQCSIFWVKHGISKSDFNVRCPPSIPRQLPSVFSNFFRFFLSFLLLFFLANFEARLQSSKFELRRSWNFEPKLQCSMFSPPPPAAPATHYLFYLFFFFFSFTFFFFHAKLRSQTSKFQLPTSNLEL